MSGTIKIKTQKIITESNLCFIHHGGRNCQTYQERFEQVKDEVISNRHQYEYHSEILDKAMEDMNNAECDNFDNVAPNAEHINQQDCTVKDKPSELFGCFDPGKNKQHNQYDLLDDIGIFPRSSDQEELTCCKAHV